MSIPFSKLLPYYLMFILLGTLERVFSTFIRKETKITKCIFQKWAFFLPFSTYLLIVLCAIIEYFLLVKAVNLYITGLGVLFFITGVFLRRKSIFDLGGNWSIYIEIKQGHELIRSGLYKFLKHPYCLAVFFELVGICLVGNSIYSLILIFVIQIPLLIIRVILEEKVLINHFGEHYITYCRGKFI